MRGGSSVVLPRDRIVERKGESKVDVRSVQTMRREHGVVKMSPTTLSMKDFAIEVGTRCAVDFDPQALDGWLRDTRIEPASLEPFVRVEPGRYTRHLVLKNRDVELLVLCWAMGAHAPIHGHEGELCWARVERGRL